MKTKTLKAFVALAFLTLMIFPAFAAEEGSILKTWEFNGMGQKEVITLTASQLVDKINGAGMPPKGVTKKKPVAKIVPGVTAKSGMVITGPSKGIMKPYEVYRWYELSGDTVKFYIDGQQYASVQEAEKLSKGNPKFARPFKQVK